MHEGRSLMLPAAAKIDISFRDFIIQVFCAKTEVEANDTNRVSCLLDTVFCIKNEEILHK